MDTRKQWVQIIPKGKFTFAKTGSYQLIWLLLSPESEV